MEQRHDSRARQLHEEALSEAEALLCAAEERVTEAVSDLAPAAYLTSCHNVAELARRQDDIETQAIFLYQGYERLVSVAESAKAPLELRSACVQHLRVASDALVAYLATHGMADAAFTYTERAKAAARQVSSLVQVSPS